MKRLLFVPLLLSSFIFPAVASAQTPQAAATCLFILGFKTLHDLAANDVGDCQDNQAFAPNGDAQQHTTKGLMAWRKADNWTAFTNGYMTWLNGPNGLVSRLNTTRFTWESDGLSAGSAVKTTPPGTVLYSDSLTDPNSGQLPKAVAGKDADKASVGYRGGEYQIQILAPGGDWNVTAPGRIHRRICRCGRADRG